MVDKTLGFPGYAEPGQLLSLTDRQAADLDISEGSAADVGAALGLFSLGDARLIYEERGLRDGAVGVLQYEYVRMVLVASAPVWLRPCCWARCFLSAATAPLPIR